MRRNVLWLSATAGFVLWLFVVIAAYHIAHKPFSGATLLAIAPAAAGLAGAALVAALGAGVGLLLLRPFDLGAAERLVWATAAGLGVLSLGTLGLGALGLLRTWLLWIVTLAGLALVARSLWRALRAAWNDPAWRPEGRFEKLLTAYCAAMLALALLYALAPPTAWDGLVYHLTGPKLYLASGRIGHPLDLPYLGFPQLMEMLFTWGMGLTGERTAAPLHWACGLLGVLTLALAGRRWLGGSAGWLAAALLLSAPTIVRLAGWPYVDLTLLLYATLAFLALTRAAEDSSHPRRWLLLSGLFAGLALSTKYTALALLPALAVASVQVCRYASAQVGKRASLHPCLAAYLHTCILITLSAVLVWAPWPLKNLLLTGNPLYPFFFGGVYWDAWRAWWYDRPGTGLASGAPWKLLTAPWDATVWGVEGGTGYSATIGPLLVALLPLLALVWRGLPEERRRWLRAALLATGVLYGFWLWGLARSALLLQTRLLFPAFGLLALAVGAAVEGARALPRRPLDLGWLVRAVLLVVLALTLVGALSGVATEGPQRVLLGLESPQDYVARRLGWYAPMMADLNQRLPPQAVVLFLWEPRSYPCRVECWPDALLDRWAHATWLHGTDPLAIAADWQARGVTHVLFFRAGYQAILAEGFDPLTAADQEALAALLAKLEPVAAWGDAYELYALTPP